jgi:RNA polymerase sigma-70 factor (ECF subfamily)
MWTQLMMLREGSTADEATEILDRLCASYWQPLFQYARRLGNPVEHAKDLTQGFFGHLLDKGLFELADREKGKLRTLLLTAFNRYIHGEYDKATAQKRGGSETTLSLDAIQEAESNYQLEADESSSPEYVYSRRCALGLLTAAMEHVEQKMVKTGKRDHFASLRQFLTVSGNDEGYSVEAAKLGVRTDNYKVMVQRFRLQFKSSLTNVVKESLPDESSEDEIKGEILEIIRLAYG